MPFDPKFNITAKTAHALMRIEGARQAVNHLPITPSVLASLRESARRRPSKEKPQIRSGE